MADTTNNETPETPKKKKKKVRTFFIRYEAIIPFVIFCGLVWAYFFFFFDNHLERALEYVGTQANGAEVNIEEVETSFWKASLEIDLIEITDADEPKKNKVQIGEMNWGMLWDALLRGKIAINEASILEVAIGVPRKRPGFVLPPEPPGSKSAFDKVREAALNKAKAEMEKNILGDIAAILGGADPKEQLKAIGDALKSGTRVKELQAELDKKKQDWQARIDRLPKNQDFQNIRERLAGIKKDNFQSPAELQASVQQIDALYKEIDAKIKDVQATGQAVGTDTNGFVSAIKDLEAMIRQDIADLEARLKIPKIDAGSISKSVFGPLFLEKVKQAEFYMAKARTFMPPKKTEEEKAAFAPPKPHEREIGRNYKFGVPNSYPLFWLRHAAISSKATKGAEWSGDLSGELKDVTDDPPILGRPTIATFRGEFPKQEFFGVKGQVTIDHTTENPMEKANIQVASFPVLGRMLVDSPEVKLGFDNASGSIDFNATLRGGEIEITSNSVFQKKRGTQTASVGTEAVAATTANTDTKDAAQASAEGPSINSGPSAAITPGTAFLTAEAKQPILAGILKGALADIPRVTLNAGVSGSWSDLRFNVNSSLGQDLVSAFDKQVQLKIAEARAQLQAKVDEEVGKQRDRLTAEFNKVKSQVDTTIAEKRAEIDKLKGQLEQAKNDAINSGKGRIEQEGKKQVEDLKKRFGF